MAHFHIERVKPIDGFTMEHAKPGDFVKVATRASMTSDDANFHDYIEQIAGHFLKGMALSIDHVSQLAIATHSDASADVYTNDFDIAIEGLAKRPIQKGEIVWKSDLADIRRLSFPSISLCSTDKIIYCGKIGWKFGLFFDLDRRNELDIKRMEFSLGELYRYLAYQHVYTSFSEKGQFERMKKDGWFPFAGIAGEEYGILLKAYKDDCDVTKRTDAVVNRFKRKRIKALRNRWWDKPAFKKQKILLEAGTNAFLQGTPDGYVNAIHTLYPQIEGILRTQYLADKGEPMKLNLQNFLDHLVEKAKAKSGSDSSLLFPTPFLEYLKNIVFADFNPKGSQIPLSRHSSAHGAVEGESFTKTKALQAILILDHMFFCL